MRAAIRWSAGKDSDLALLLARLPHRVVTHCPWKPTTLLFQPLALAPAP